MFTMNGIGILHCCQSVVCVFSQTIIGVGRLESLSRSIFSCGWNRRNICGTDRLTTENLTLCVLAVLVVSTLHMSSSVVLWWLHGGYGREQWEWGVSCVHLKIASCGLEVLW